ncbi:MAG: ribonuclease P [Candidatus Diapherotrites archaeon]|nr:ribonuclease P [Candidatus Diapherotrites archaeon]
MKQNRKIFIKQISLERIYRLFELAGKEFEKHPERSKRYVELARRISERNRVKIPKELKTKFCRRCNAFLMEGKNMEFFTKHGLRFMRCKECGYERAVAKA